MVEQVDDIQHELIREAFRKTRIDRGVEISTMGDIPAAGTGLGSSSTVTIGALHALYTLLGEIVPAERLAREACEIEIDILGKPIGIQDQYIAAYGGLRFIEFHTDNLVSVERIHLCPEHIRRLNENLLLFYTGRPRSAAAILKEQVANIKERMKILQSMGGLARLARQQLEAGEVDTIGDLLHESWLLKKELARGISNVEIDDLYAKARRAGALGRKDYRCWRWGFLTTILPA